MSDDVENNDDNPGQEVTRDKIEERVADWKQRLELLFGRIRDWAGQNNWIASDGGTVEMNEELMRTTGVPPTRQPVLRLDRTNQYALFKPKGLWVIGANGRIDLHTSKGTYVMVDLADPGTEAQWTIFRNTPKRDGTPFSPEIIENLV